MSTTLYFIEGLMGKEAVGGMRQRTDIFTGILIG